MSRWKADADVVAKVAVPGYIFNRMVVTVARYGREPA
jgi:hypothetical protein